MSNLNSAINIATKAHQGQFDKAGKPYILHPLRLMLRLETEPEMMVAVMHDVVEDSNITLIDLEGSGFPAEVIAAIDCLTKRDGEDYDSFIARVAKNSLARKVKIEDIKDNLDLTRLKTLSEKDLQRVQKYHRALSLLESSATD